MCYIQFTPQLELPCCLFRAARHEDTEDSVSFLKSCCREAEPTHAEKTPDAQAVRVPQCVRTVVGCFMRSSISPFQGEQPLLYSN